MSLRRCLTTLARRTVPWNPPLRQAQGRLFEPRERWGSLGRGSVRKARLGEAARGIEINKVRLCCRFCLCATTIG